MGIKLYPHQKKAMIALDNGKILAGGVGTGKSITALAYFFIRVCGGRIGGVNSEVTKKPIKPIPLYIITTAKKRDSLEWEGEYSRFAMGKTDDGWNWDIPIVIDSWNNIKKYVGVKNAFFIFDEQRLVGSGAWVSSFLSISRNNRWILLSATPGDQWVDYIPVFVANGFYRNRSHFRNRHIIYNTYGGFPKIERYVDVEPLEKARSKILVNMPVERHTTRFWKYIECDYDKDVFKKLYKDRWNPYDDEPVNNISQLFSLLRRTTNEHPSRLEAVKETFKKHQRLIIFYNFDYELDQLRTLKDILKVDVAEWNGHKHEPIPESDSWLYLVQYSAGEGWNCITTNAMVFYSLNYSYRVVEQAAGRIDRINTPYAKLYYYQLFSKTWLDAAIRRALSEKKNFNEKGIISGDWFKG